MNCSAYQKIHVCLVSVTMFVCQMTWANQSVEDLIQEFSNPLPLPDRAFELRDADLPMIDYTQFGVFDTTDGTKTQFILHDEEGLRKVIGAGIYPDDDSVVQDSDYQAYLDSGMLEGSHWDFLAYKDLKLAFYKWATAGEDSGVKLFFTGAILEKAGHLKAALRAYYAAFIHFNHSVCWSKGGAFFWYVAPAALSNIFRICRDYPQLNIRLQSAWIHIENKEDFDVTQDLIHISPGTWVSNKIASPVENSNTVVACRGTGKVSIIQYEDNSFDLRVNHEVFVIKGVSYSPTKIGIGPKNDRLYKTRWMFSDDNQNGKIDAAYDSYVDKNHNLIQDENEVAIGDFQLLKDMGCNAIRMYHVPSGPGKYEPKHLNKELLRSLVNDFGIYVMLGDFLGAYTVGTSADWGKGVDYTNPLHRNEMKQIVRDMVLDLKDEPFILLWILGNENNMPLSYNGVNSTRTNASIQKVAYATFLNEVAGMIHELDPDHPVALGNLGTGLMEVYQQHTENIDIFGINAYQGSHGFGLTFSSVKQNWNKPVLITEFGCDAYYQGRGVDEAGQKEYIWGCMRDIVCNVRGGRGEGNAIGGVVFQFMDEWWKDTHSGDSEFNHQILPQNAMPFPDGEAHEEWFGIMGQGDGKHSPFYRHPREAYTLLKNAWN